MAANVAAKTFHGCQKRCDLAGTCCNFNKWSPLKFLKLPKMTKQLLTFLPRLRASIIPVLTDCITTRLHMQNPSSSLGLKDTIYFKPQVARLCKKYLKDISPSKLLVITTKNDSE